MSARKPVVHLLKPGLLSDIKTRCGLPLDSARKGEFVGTEDSLDAVSCAGCLRELIFEMRLDAAGSKRSADKAMKWRHGGDVGTSSLTIWSVMTDTPSGGRYDIPHDPDDFGRCHRLLEQFPEWRPRLGEVARLFKKWQPLVDSWDELTALYLKELPSGRAPKLYDRMKQLSGRSSP